MKKSFLGAISNPERGILPRVLREKLFEGLLEDIENGTDKEAIRASWAIFKIAIKSPKAEKLAQAIPVFASGLGHSEGKVSYCCQRILVMIGEKSVPSLIETIKSGNEEECRLAIIALGQIRSISALETLLEAIEKNPQNGYETAKGIGQIAQANHNAPALAAAARKCVELTYSEELMVQKNATIALGKIGGPGDIVRLVELMEDPSYMVQMDAALAIGDIFERYPDTERSPELINALKRGSVNENSGVMFNSMYAVSKSGVGLGRNERLQMLWEMAKKIRKEKGKDAIRLFRDQYLQELRKMQADAKEHVAKKGIVLKGNRNGKAGEPPKKMRRVLA